MLHRLWRAYRVLRGGEGSPRSHRRASAFGQRRQLRAAQRQRQPGSTRPSTLVCVVISRAPAGEQRDARGRAHGHALVPRRRARHLRPAADRLEQRAHQHGKHGQRAGLDVRGQRARDHGLPACQQEPAQHRRGDSAHRLRDRRGQRVALQPEPDALVFVGAHPATGGEHGRPEQREVRDAQPDPGQERRLHGAPDRHRFDRIAERAQDPDRDGGELRRRHTRRRAHGHARHDAPGRCRPARRAWIGPGHCLRSRPDADVPMVGPGKAGRGQRSPLELGVVATDQTGRSSEVGVVTVNVEPCGDVSPTVAGIGVVSGAPGTPPAGTVGTAISVQAVNVSSLNCLATGTVATEWSLTVPSGSVSALSDATASSPSFTPDRPGDYRLAVQVSDSLGNKSAPAFLQITAAPCTPVPIEWGTQPITATATDPQAGAPSFTDGNGNPMPHVGAPVQLTPHATVPSYCGSIPTGPLSWSWTLSSRASESEAALDSSKTESPSIRVDKNGHYGFSVVATDALGNRSTPKTLEIDTTTCGVNPVSTTLLTGAGAPLESSPQTPVNVGSFAPFTIAAQIATDDNLPAACPVRFRVSADFSYQLAIQPSTGSGSLSNVIGDSTVFEALAAGAYAVDVDGAVSNLAGRVHASPAFVYFNVASCTPPALSTPIFSVGGGSSGVFKGDVVTLAVVVVPGNCGAISSQLTYSWTLSRPPGSAASLISATSATSSFSPDVAGASFAVSVAVTDGQGNTSTSQSLVIATSPCGNSPIFADIADTPGARAFDDHAFSAVPTAGRTTFSDDDTTCPARFAGQYSFSWSVVSSAPSVGYAFDSTSGQTVRLTPGGNAVYSVKLVVKGPTQRAEVMKLVTVSCPDVVPKTGALSVASSTPGYAPGRFFLGDTATLSADPTSLCYSAGSTSYSHLWSLERLSGGAATLSSTTASHPTFAVDVAGGAWLATVTVVDKLGNRSSPAQASFESQTCGVNPVIATLTDTRAGASPFAAFDPHDLQATASSADDDAAVCPARFKNVYAFNLQVTPPAGAAKWKFTPSSPTTGRFEAGQDGVFLASVDATGNKSGLTGTASSSIGVNCATPTPTTTAPAIASVSDPAGITVPAKIFRDETVTLATTPSAACYTGTNFHPNYQWSFGSGTTDALAAFSSATTPTPDFLVHDSGATYEVQVEARDQWGNGPASNSSIFVAENCGRNPVVVSVAGAQATGAALPFDPWIVSASASSADDDASQCPQPRFAQAYAFTWAVSAFPTGATRFALSPMAGPQTVFTEGEPASGVYAVKATATGSKSGVQGDGTASIATATCATPGPTFPGGIGIAPDAIGIARVTPPVADAYYASHPGRFFKDDLITLTRPATFACYTSQALAVATYAWRLTTDTPPMPAITQVPGAPASATFTADQSNRTYHSRVDVADHWGHSDFRTRDISSGICGSSPINNGLTIAGDFANPANTRPQDPRSLRVIPPVGGFFSADSDPAQCPARFGQAVVYTFKWELLPSGDSTLFNPINAQATTFTPKADLVYNVRVTVAGSGTPSFMDRTVNATCSANHPVATSRFISAPPSVLEQNGVAYTGGPFFKNDLLKLQTSVVQGCLTNTTLSYTWVLEQPAGTDMSALLSSQTAAQPIFQTQDFGVDYVAKVILTDGNGNISTQGTNTFRVSACGSLAPTATYLATQHFDGIVQRLPGDPADTTASLDITQASNTLTPTATVTVGGTPHSFAVPFYLDRSIGIDVTLAFTDCPNVQFAGAMLFDPTFALVPQDRFTQPPPSLVTNGGHLQFAFTPSMGDVTVGTTVNPGYYFLSLDVTSGGSNDPETAIVQPNQINVGGRCGLNAPFVDAHFDPASPSRVGTPVTGTAIPSDADNDTLLLTLATPDPGTSEGCGLNQSFSYAWSFASVPGGSAASLVPPDAGNSTFIPDLTGAYSVQLVVGDGTTSGAAGDGKASETFPYSAGP